jgi:hypothetical protein
MTFTRTQRLILDVLADGRPHLPSELASAFDSHTSLANLRHHLAMIRHKLRQRGEWIDAVYHNRRLHYRHVKLLRPSSAHPCTVESAT